MRNAVLMIVFLSLAGCSNPWAAGYLPSPLLGKQEFKPVSASDVRPFQFEKLQQFARFELAIGAATKRSATQPTSKPFNPFPSQSAQTRLLNTLSLTRDQVTIIGWSEFENWDLVNADEVRLLRFAKHVGADYVLVCSTYFDKPAHDVVRPRTAWLESVAPLSADGGPFAKHYPPLIWYRAGKSADKYLYDVLFFKKR